MPSSLSEIYRNAFITGAASGLGLAFTEMLLSEGLPVWGTSRDAARLAPLASRHAGCFHPVVLDLCGAAPAEAAYLGAAAQAGDGFDLVINNAGYGVFGGFETTSADEWQAQIDAMLGATLRITHAAYRGMRERNRGCLVNVSSIAAEFPIPFMSGYNVAKAGLSALSESLLFESRGSAVSVIDFRPGDYRTSFNQSMRRNSHAGPASPRTEAVWRVLEGNLSSAPEPARAAADLRRALRRRKRGVVRSGSFFQVRLAPLLARLGSASFVRAGTAWYFGSS
jgi:short-subunit dehydrogenase